jgi:hypothetical protein
MVKIIVILFSGENGLERSGHICSINIHIVTKKALPFFEETWHLELVFKAASVESKKVRR